MQSEDDAGEVLEEVARIHSVLDRLRDLIASATFLDLKANSKGYWAARSDEGEQATISP